MKVLLFVAGAVGALVLLLGSNAPAGPRAVLVRAGKRYRVKGELVAPLSTLQVAALAVSMQAAGFSAVKLEVGKKEIEFTTPVQTAEFSIVIGQAFALPGGQSVEIKSITEVI